jgi:hypothetical protein
MATGGEMADGIGWGDRRLIDFGLPDKRRPAIVFNDRAQSI